MQVAFDDLPLRRPGPPYNAWGQFGPDDELGRLNLITPEVVRAARDEIEQGLVINLKSVITPSMAELTSQYATIDGDCASNETELGARDVSPCAPRSFLAHPS